MGSTTPATARKPIHEVMPPLVAGTGTFNYQFVPDPHNPDDLPANAIVKRALDLGINAFDTSPYYGPSEIILGNALVQPAVTSKYPRESYFLVTKAGRIGGREFDYSPSWVRYSVCRSLERLHTTYLDLVYMHDVEFVTPDEVLAAVRELRKLRDEGVIHYVGICGYPIDTLCDLAEMILEKTGEPLDAVQNYCHFCIQNSTLATSALERFRKAGVDVVPNASMLAMGLLTTIGVDGGLTASWHPSPKELRKAVAKLVGVAQENGEKLEPIAIRWALDNWARDGAVVGGTSPQLPAGTRAGISVFGVAAMDELEETAAVFKSVVEGLYEKSSSEEAKGAHQRSLERRQKVQGVVEKMWGVLGEWKDFSWTSPDEGFMNTRKSEAKGVVPDDEVAKKYHLR